MWDWEFLLRFTYKCSSNNRSLQSKVVSFSVLFNKIDHSENKLSNCFFSRSEVEWQVHVKVKHLESQLRCQICPYTCTTQGDLLEHSASHQRPWACPVCQETFSVEYLLEKHVQDVHGNESDHVKRQDTDGRSRASSTEKADSWQGSTLR